MKKMIVSKNFCGTLIYEYLECVDITEILTTNQIENLKKYGKTVIAEGKVKVIPKSVLIEESRRLTGLLVFLKQTENGYLLEALRPNGEPIAQE